MVEEGSKGRENSNPKAHVITSRNQDFNKNTDRSRLSTYFYLYFLDEMKVYYR